MPKSKTQTPSEVLQKYIDEYQTNPFALSKSLDVAYQTVTHILKGKSRITAQMAVKLAKHFGNTPNFWLDIQAQSEINELSANKKFTATVNKIPKAAKPTAKVKLITQKKKSRTSYAKPNKQAAKAKSKKKVKAFKTDRAKKK